GAEDVVALGLAVELVDPDAQCLLAPGIGGRAEALARRADGAERQPVALARPRHGAHHLDRRRRQERAGDAGPGHQFERLVGIEAAERTEYDRDAEIEAR